MRFRPNIVWNPKCVPKFVDSYSPSWKKPWEFVKHISAKAGSDGVEFHQSESARDILNRVHRPSFVEGVLSGELLNGFGGRDPAVADSCTYTAGAFVEGVMRAREGWTSCVPVSGFHHSGYDFSGGFCTFNGLALAAVVAKGLGMNPGMVDLDMHYSNGTVDILEELGMVKDLPLFSYGGSGYDGHTKSSAFIKDLRSILEYQFSECGVLLYQAGADPHIDDPLGGCLTTEQMKDRDDIVFKFAQDKQIPVCWVLAGGYQRDFKKVLALHEQTYNSWLAHA